MIYINTTEDGTVRTIDEAPTVKEAKKIIRRYSCISNENTYYMSNRCSKKWKAKQ